MSESLCPRWDAFLSECGLGEAEQKRLQYEFAKIMTIGVDIQKDGILVSSGADHEIIRGN